MVLEIFCDDQFNPSCSLNAREAYSTWHQYYIQISEYTKWCSTWPPNSNQHCTMHQDSTKLCASTLCKTPKVFLVPLKLNPFYHLFRSECMCGVLGRVVNSQLVAKTHNLRHSGYATLFTLCILFHCLKQASMDCVQNKRKNLGKS